jgi:hypothetical protein
MYSTIAVVLGEFSVLWHFILAFAHIFTFIPGKNFVVSNQAEGTSKFWPASNTT